MYYSITIVLFLIFEHVADVLRVTGPHKCSERGNVERNIGFAYVA